MHAILTIFSMVMNVIQMCSLVPDNHDLLDMIRDMKGVLHDDGDDGAKKFQV